MFQELSSGIRNFLIQWNFTPKILLWESIGYPSHNIVLKGVGSFWLWFCFFGVDLWQNEEEIVLMLWRTPKLLDKLKCELEVKTTKE
jgi:hypothetical protein